MQRSRGALVDLVSGPELAKIEPDWRVDDVEAAAYEPESGYGDGAGVASGFLAAAGIDVAIETENHCMAELIAEGAGTVDLTPFRPGRSAEGQPIKADFEYQDD